MKIEKRKLEHLKIVRSKDVVSGLSTGFSDVLLLPNSLPELNFDQIDIKATFLGQKFNTPFLISSMTGGAAEATEINKILARAAQKFGLIISVGSQKAMIKYPDLSVSYKIREYAPDVFIIGNIGIDYLISPQYKLDDLKTALKSIDANALFVHLNVAQELVQPEGERSFVGALDQITSLCKDLDCPVLVKEVGAGVDPDTAKRLELAGVAAIDVAGAGGTAWTKIERYRRLDQSRAFDDWGIPTALNLLMLKKYKSGLPVIASGGITDGLMAAKSLVMGASLVGLARALITEAFRGEEALNTKIVQLIRELKSAMLLVGAKNIEELQSSKYLVKGDLARMLEQVTRN